LPLLGHVICSTDPCTRASFVHHQAAVVLSAEGERDIEKETKELQVIFLKDESCFVRGEDNDRPERSNGTGSIVTAIDIARLPFSLSRLRAAQRILSQSCLREDRGYFVLPKSVFLYSWRSPFPRTSPIDS